jgi:hypothetical protein
MAVLGFADNDTDTVFIRKAVFRMILDRAKALLTDPADIYQLDVCKAMEGVSCELLDEDQRTRLGMRSSTRLRRSGRTSRPGSLLRSQSGPASRISSTKCSLSSPDSAGNEPAWMAVKNASLRSRSRLLPVASG